MHYSQQYLDVFPCLQFVSTMCSTSPSLQARSLPPSHTTKDPGGNFELEFNPNLKIPKNFHISSNQARHRRSARLTQESARRRGRLPKPGRASQGGSY
eukprot:764311-Hanusia_phi.AAC.1